ncbi:hypothetical protein GGI25_000491 [Coemansia spiralis]|uniref:PH domain-containing protein n=2 Tax=Coemansia TaxID=4863 RepID=A0A9W8GC38_9FUNG|nr:hypothetical protein EDC05_000319 [Coemansia umbellata]KAJ2625396.1 hypothetical protein GGI26_000536 [Coemansia sp. RSA 1358]KAJ2680518.1 hypothetical protein GGI25_000491 [Coemansia spiralis]
MLSSASRRLKTITRRRGRMPIGTVVDNAGQTHSSAGPNEYSGDVAAAAAPMDTKGFSTDEKRSGYPGRDDAGGMAPPMLASNSSDGSGRTAMVGSATQDDVVVFRINSWRILVKEYTSYFEHILSIEKSVYKSLEKATGEFPVPLRTDHCFAGVERNGVQQLGAQLKEVHRMYASQHARTIQSIEGNTLAQLESLRVEIKDSLKMYTDHLGPIYRRLRKQAKEVEECKEKLVHAVEAYKKKHRGSDAWLAQQQVRRELTKQAEVENALFKAVQAERARLSRWEVTICERLRDIIAAAVVCDRDCAQSNMGTINNCLEFMERFDINAEQHAFEAHFGTILQNPMGLSGASSLADYDYMYRNSEPTTVLLEGPLEREKGLIKNYKPTYAVLTTQGYLHCFSEQKNLLEKNPDISFNLSNCTVKPLDDTRTFQVSINHKKVGHSKYLFRASDPAYVNHWINAISSAAVKPVTRENYVVGGTLRDSKAAREAAAANANAPTNALPTAAGVTFGELAARNASEDAATAKAANDSAAESPLESDNFYPARDYVNEPAANNTALGPSLNSVEATREADGASVANNKHANHGPLPEYSNNTSPDIATVVSAESPVQAHAQPPAAPLTSAH